MDQKRTQRIIGIVIVIALVIILFPLLFSKNEPQSTVTTVQAPPFPDQQTTAPKAQLAEANQEGGVEPGVEQPTLDSAPIKGAIIEQSQPATTEEVKMEQTSNVEPLITPPEVEASAINDNNAIETPKLDEPVASTPVSDVVPAPMEEMIEQTPPAPQPKPTKHAKKMVTAKAKAPQHASPHEIAKLNQVAWAVQMGSFRNKNNAHRLADKLRASGYKAFTREIASKHGSQMRVYVGPEFKQMAARKLSSDLERDMNLHGIVVAYKPLAL